MRILSALLFVGILCCATGLNAQVVIPPVTALACTVDVDVVTASWTNPSAYDAINVSVDGVAQAPLAGDATSFTSDPFVGQLPATVVIDVIKMGITRRRAAYTVACNRLMPASSRALAAEINTIAEFTAIPASATAPNIV